MNLFDYSLSRHTHLLACAKGILSFKTELVDKWQMQEFLIGAHCDIVYNCRCLMDTVVLMQHHLPKITSSGLLLKTLTFQLALERLLRVLLERLIMHLQMLNLLIVPLAPLP